MGCVNTRPEEEQLFLHTPRTQSYTVDQETPVDYETQLSVLNAQIESARDSKHLHTLMKRLKCLTMTRIQRHESLEIETSHRRYFSIRH